MRDGRACVRYARSMVNAYKDGCPSSCIYGSMGSHRYAYTLLSAIITAEAAGGARIVIRDLDNISRSLEVPNGHPRRWIA